MKTKQLIEKLKEYIKALEKRVGNYELSHIELINLRHSICILEGKLEFASIEQKREKIIEILAKYYPNFANIEKVADAILAIEPEQKDELIKFLSWYKSLSPSEKCTVHPPAGSGGGYGIYNLTDAGLINIYLNKTPKP